MSKEVPKANEPVKENEKDTLKSEQTVIISILMNNDNYYKIQDIIKAGDFSTKLHKKIYQSIEELIKENQTISLFTIYEKLDSKVKEKLGEMQIYNYIAELTTIADFTKDIVYHAKLVKENSNTNR